MIDFKDSEEQNSKFPAFQRAGIHDFKVLDFYYQPVGDSVKDIKKGDGSTLSFDKENLMIHVKCEKSYTEGKSEGAESHLRINFNLKNDDKDKSRVDRLFHILSNISTSDKKEEFKGQLKKAAFKNKEEIATRLAKVVTGREVRFKLTASEEGKGAYLPGYFAGFAECVDVPFEKSTLKFDEAKEGNKKKDTSKIEAKGPEIDLFGNSSNASTSAPQVTGNEEDVPF